MAREIRIHADRRPGSGSRELDAAAGRWATARCGVVTRRALRGPLDASVGQISRRLASGLLRETAYEGVYVWGHGAFVPGQREAIALAASGPRATLAGRSAAGLRGQRDPWRGDVELIVPHGRHRPLPGLVRSVAALPPDDLARWRGLRLTTPERTAMDLPAEDLRDALQWLMRQGIAVEALVERMHGRRGARAFRAEVAQLVPQLAHTSSELEARLVRLCRRYGISLPVVNGTLVGGELLDCTWPGRRLVVELDGRRWHEGHFEADRARDRRRVLEGRVPLRFGWDDVVVRHARTASEVIRGLAL